jgi:hypothetical protein
MPWITKKSDQAPALLALFVQPIAPQVSEKQVRPGLTVAADPEYARIKL